MATIDLMDRFGNLGSGGIRNNGTLDAEAMFQPSLRTMRTDFIQVKSGDSIVYKNMNGMSSSWNILSFYTGDAQGFYVSGIAGQTTPQSGVWTAQQDGYVRLFGSFPAGDNISVTMTDLAPDVEDYLAKYNAMNYRFLPNSIPKIVAHIQEYLSNHPIADSTTLQAVIDAAFQSYLEEIQETADNYIAEAVPPAASAAVDAAASPALAEITAKAAEAAESARQAGLSQQSAEMSEENALTYRNQAQQIKDSITAEVAASVQAAQEQATLAQESAQAADQSADTAEQYVALSRAQAEAAAAQAQTASGYASDAQGYMQNASDYADAAAQSAATFTTDPTLTIAGKAADAKATGDQLSDLKSVIDAISTGNDTEFPLNTTWSQGGVNQEGEYSSWSRIRTDYIDLEGIGELIQIPASGYASCSVIYDSNKQVLRYTLWSTQNVTVSLADNEKYIRFSLRKDPESNLSPSARVNLTAKAVYKLPSDVVSNSNAIKQMKSFAVNDLIWELGGVSSGANFSSNTRIRTQFLDVSNYGRLTAIAQTGYKYVVNVFDKSKNYLFMIPAGGFVTGENIIEADENIGFIKVMLATANDDTLSDTSISSNFSLEADWKATGEIKNIANNDDNLLDGVTWVRGILDNDGAYISSTSRAVTDEYITISGLKSLRFHPLISTVWYAVFFFGDNGVISKTGTVIGDTEISVPSNSTKIKIYISNNPEAWLNDATIGNTLKLYKGTLYDQSNNGNILTDDYFCSTCVNKKEIPNLESGTTVLAFGDSITAEQTSAGWVYHFAAMTGCTVVDKAVGGSTFGHTETDSGHWISTQIENTSDETWSDADLVIVAAGTNDYGHGEPLDGIKEYVQDAIDAIRAKTNVPIVFITPIRRGLSIYDDPMKKLPMISGIISNVALANQCNVISGFDIPVPTYNINGLIDNMTRDGLHPIATGANVYARFVIGALT